MFLWFHPLKSFQSICTPCGQPVAGGDQTTWRGSKTETVATSPGLAVVEPAEAQKVIEIAAADWQFQEVFCG